MLLHNYLYPRVHHYLTNMSCLFKIIICHLFRINALKVTMFMFAFSQKFLTLIIVLSWCRNTHFIYHLFLHVFFRSKKYQNVAISLNCVLYQYVVLHVRSRFLIPSSIKKMYTSLFTLAQKYFFGVKILQNLCFLIYA